MTDRATEDRIACLEAAVFRQAEQLTRLQTQLAALLLTRKPEPKAQPKAPRPISLPNFPPPIANDFIEKYRQALDEPGKIVEFPKYMRIGDLMP